MIDWNELEAEFADYAIARARAILDETERLTYLHTHGLADVEHRIHELCHQWEVLSHSRVRDA